MTGGILARICKRISCGHKGLVGYCCGKNNFSRMLNFSVRSEMTFNFIIKRMANVAPSFRAQGHHIALLLQLCFRMIKR